MKKFFIVLAILVLPLGIIAETPEEYLMIAKEQTEDALKELREIKATGALEIEKGSAYSEYKTSGLGSEYFKKTAESPYTKSKIAQGISAAALSAASAVGTEMQQSAIEQLLGLSSDLKNSGVKEYQEMAAMLEQQVEYMKTGDSISSKNLANSIAAYAKTNLPVDPNYKPTASEMAALNPFAAFFQGFLNSILSILSNQAITLLSAALGSIFGPLGTAAGGGIGAMINSLAMSLITNQPIDAANLGSMAAGGLNSSISTGTSNIAGLFPTYTVQQTPGTGVAAMPTQAPAKELEVGKSVPDDQKVKNK